MSVVAHSTASAGARWARSEACWSRNAAVCPPTSASNGAGTARTARTSCLAGSPSAGPGAIRSMRAAPTRGGATGCGSRCAYARTSAREVPGGTAT